MPSFNSVTLVGNATRDPQFKYLPNQTAVCEWGMAMNRKFTVGEEQREEVTFVDVTAFGKLAEIVNKYVTKGKPVLVSGRLRYESWDDKNGGGKRSKLTVIADTMQLLGGRDDRDGGGQDRQQDADDAPGFAGGPPPTQRRPGGGGGQSKMFIGGGNRGPGLPDANRGRATSPPADAGFTDDEVPFVRFPNPLASHV